MGLAEASAEMAGGCAASYERVCARAGSTCAGVQCAQGVMLWRDSCKRWPARHGVAGAEALTVSCHWCVSKTMHPN